MRHDRPVRSASSVDDNRCIEIETRLLEQGVVAPHERASLLGTVDPKSLRHRHLLRRCAKERDVFRSKLVAIAMSINALVVVPNDSGISLQSSSHARMRSPIYRRSARLNDP